MAIVLGGSLPALTALNVCGAPARDSYQRVWKHARAKAQRVLAKAAQRRAATRRSGSCLAAGYI